MTDPSKVLVVMTLIGGITVTIKVIASAVLRYQEMQLRHSRPLESPETMARLERMEHAVDAIAVEVERISEGQRFTTKLLSDRQLSSANQGER